MIEVSPRRPPSVKPRSVGGIMIAFGMGAIIAMFGMMFLFKAVMSPGGHFALTGLTDTFSVFLKDRTASSSGASAGVAFDGRTFATVYIPKNKDSNDKAVRINYSANNGEMLMQLVVGTPVHNMPSFEILNWESKRVALFEPTGEGKFQIRVGERIAAEGTIDAAGRKITFKMSEGPLLATIELREDQPAQWDVLVTNVSRFPTPGYALIAGYYLLIPQAVPEKTEK